MDPDEQKWIERAVELCETAKRKSVTLLLMRKQDANDQADVVVTNAESPELVAALNGNYGNYEPQEDS